MIKSAFPPQTSTLKGEHIFHLINGLIMVMITLLMLYPFWYCIILSFNDAVDATRGPLFLWPRKLTFENYQFVLTNPYLSRGFFNSIARTVLGTLLHILFTGMAAYGLSKKQLVGRFFYTSIFVITMYFSGGLIPTYLLIRGIGLIDNFLVYIIPSMWSFYHAILFMAFYQSIPDSLEESARIDGANSFVIYLRIILPVSLPIFATIAVFHGVAQWNSWFDTMIYTSSDKLVTLQSIMTKMIHEANAILELQKMMIGLTDMPKVTTTSVRVATMIVTAFPVIVIYPFLQKYFVKGLMLGAEKG